MVSVQGYPPTNINYCPECGDSGIDISDHWNDGAGLLVCGSCGLQCYIVEGEDSHTDAQQIPQPGATGRGTPPERVPQTDMEVTYK